MAKTTSSPNTAKTPSSPPPLARVEPTTDTEYTVVARRYRPQQFRDLVGQEAVAKALSNALQSGRIAHAYLFTGARGVGKTSTARILAKALNCVQGPTPTPCDVCDICQAIASGEDIDVLEIDGASNRGIDEVRAIRQNVATRPSRARYKIYIIDEVHMLTLPAFNALLKTLEEPPAHVKFIFATTEVNKIPITILSRCQRFDFGGISPHKIAARLRQVVAEEGMTADEEALQLIARRAGGSMRDAQSLLDQLLAFGGDRLTVQQVHALLGTASDERMVALADAILKADPKTALHLLTQAVDEGLQLSELLDQLIEYWRSLMLASAGGTELLATLPDTLRERVHLQAKALAMDTILAGLDVLSTTKARLKQTGHAQLLLEMAIVRLCRLDNLIAVTQLAQAMTQPNAVQVTGSLSAAFQRAQPPHPAAAVGFAASPVSSASAAGPISATPAVPATAAHPPVSAAAAFPAAAPASGVTPPGQVPNLGSAPESSDAAKKKPPVVPVAPGPNGSVWGAIGNAATSVTSAAPPASENVNISELWPLVLKQLGPMHASQIQRAGIPAIIGPKTLAVRFPAEYSRDYDFCSTTSNVQKVESALRQLTASQWAVRMELTTDRSGANGSTGLAGSTSSGAASKPLPARGSGSLREQQKEVLQIPLVQRAVELLGATLLRVDPGFGATQRPTPTRAPEDDDTE